MIVFLYAYFWCGKSCFVFLDRSEKVLEFGEFFFHLPLSRRIKVKTEYSSSQKAFSGNKNALVAT